MKKEIYGCACCSPEFGNIFHGNKIEVFLRIPFNQDHVCVDAFFDHAEWCIGIQLFSFRQAFKQLLVLLWRSFFWV